MSGPTLVAGAAGFFGLAIVRALARAGVEVVATDRVGPDAFAPRSGTASDRVEYVPRDLERESIADLVADAATVVYAAAVTPRGETTPDIAERLLAVNLEGYLAVLRSACRSARCRRVVFVSSSSVYGPSRHGAITEDDVDADGSLYSAAKLAAELIGRSYAREHRLELCAVRPTSLIGPGETERPSRPRVTPFARMVRAARDGTPVRLMRAASRGDWLAVDDAAEAVALLCVVPQLDADVFNLSSGVARPFAELADAAQRVGGLRVEDDAELVVDGGDDLPATVSNARVAAAVSWRPSRSPDDIVRELLASLDEREWAEGSVDTGSTLA